MAKIVNSVIVVEGKSDQAFLQNFIEADFVLTNGSEVPRETIEYLQVLSKTRNIIVFTDPDSPGRRIRAIIENNVSGVQHAFIEKKYCIKKNKVGIAESDQEHILAALEHLCGGDRPDKGCLAMDDLYKLGLMGQKESAQLREYISIPLHIGCNNAKTLLKRLNSLNVSFAEIQQLIKERAANG